MGTRFRVAYQAAMCTTKLQKLHSTKCMVSIWKSSSVSSKENFNSHPQEKPQKNEHIVTVCCTDCVRSQYSLQSFVFLEHASRNLAIGSQYSFHKMAPPFTTVASIAFFQEKFGSPSSFSRNTHLYPAYYPNTLPPDTHVWGFIK